MNAFIERTYNSIKAIKPWVKFGISPFGIWRPGYPAQIRGKDAYSELYADSRKWLANGWLDYCAPQLYWPIEAKGQSFPGIARLVARAKPERSSSLAGLEFNQGRRRWLGTR